MSQGEYIAPEKIEVVIGKHELVAQSFVYGDSLQSTLVAVVVLDWDSCKPWAASQNIKASTLSELYASPELKKKILSILDKHCRSNDLKGFEIVKNLYFANEPFTPENGLLSPTFKLKVYL